MKQKKVDTHTVLQAARVLWRKSHKTFTCTQTEERRFRSTFGCASKIVVELWSLLLRGDDMPEKANIFHLMKALLFLKLYPTEKTLCVLTADTDEKTNRKWNMKMIVAIAALESKFVSFASMLFLLPRITLTNHFLSFSDCVGKQKNK